MCVRSCDDEQTQTDCTLRPDRRSRGAGLAGNYCISRGMGIVSVTICRPDKGGVAEMSESQALYDKAAALDNQDVPLEEWPAELIDALDRAGYAIVPKDLPFDVLGDAAMAGVFDTGNPKNGWDYLIARLQAAAQIRAEMLK